MNNQEECVNLFAPYSSLSNKQRKLDLLTHQSVSGLSDGRPEVAVLTAASESSVFRALLEI